MEKEKLAEYLKTIPKPEPKESARQGILKMTLLTARRSSRIGLLLIAFPLIIIILYISRILFHFTPGYLQLLEKETLPISTLLRAVTVFVFLVCFPLLAVVLNLWSLSHFQFDRVRREFNISFKIRWWNILIILLGAALATYYIFHLLPSPFLAGKK
jgi:magnesium-transporting ATPase (P-type)